MITSMPIYMDIHIVPGVKAREVAEAHRMDMLLQEQHQCKCMTYWIDEGRQNVFCLIEAPEKEAVERMHAHSHGMVPHKIIEVSSSVVESFLGRIYDPSDAEVTEDGLKLIRDTSFRILMLTRINDPVLLKYKLGHNNAAALLDAYINIVRKYLKQYGGKEAEHEGAGFIASFCYASNAVSCAVSIQREMSGLENSDHIDFSVAINAGDPVGQGDKLFSDTLQMAGYMCEIAENFQVAVSSSVKELVSKDHFLGDNRKLLALPPQDENVLRLLFTKLEENWQDPEFDMNGYCQATIMSKSQLYRKVVGITGLSPNLLLKDFRLEKAREMMKKKNYNIAQITYECGFASASYFTKCFKKKYGLLPMEYIDLLD